MKFAKYFVLLVAVTSLLTFCAFSDGPDFEIKVGNDYASCYENGQKTKVVNRLNEINSNSKEKYTVKKFETMLLKNNIKFFAVNRYNSLQLRVSVYSDSISKNIEDLSIRSDGEIKEYAENLIADTELSYKLYTKNSKKYIQISKLEEDAGGEYISSQFITVCNGKIYNISFYNDGKKLNEDCYKILDTFEVKDLSVPSRMTIYIAVIIALGIAVLATVIIIMIIGIVKDKRKTGDL